MQLPSQLAVRASTAAECALRTGVWLPRLLRPAAGVLSPPPTASALELGRASDRRWRLAWPSIGASHNPPCLRGELNAWRHRSWRGGGRRPGGVSVQGAMSAGEMRWALPTNGRGAPECAQAGACALAGMRNVTRNRCQPAMHRLRTARAHILGGTSVEAFRATLGSQREPGRDHSCATSIPVPEARTLAAAVLRRKMTRRRCGARFVSVRRAGPSKVEHSNGARPSQSVHGASTVLGRIS